MPDEQACPTAATERAPGESSRRSTGEAGFPDLAQHLDAYRKSECRAAEVLRTFAVVIVFITMASLARAPHTALTLADVLQRALIAFPAFGLARYLAAE